MLCTYSSLSQLPEKLIPRHLVPTQETILPSPAVDLSAQLPSQQMDANVFQTWNNAFIHSQLFIAHALSIASLRRVINAYFTNPQALDVQQLIKYSVFTILAVRQLISGSLIDVRQKKSERVLTRNSVGYLITVPAWCLHTINLTDADVPMEHYGVSQQAYRKLILATNNTLNQSKICLLPQDILASSLNVYNEIAFVPRTIHPHSQIKIEGIFINKNVNNFGTQTDKKDPNDPEFYFTLMRQLATLLHLPLLYI
ncbi:hypothetical protein [Candidatus Odyssella thessalonicensis]|uniref:hypothetical protein n=1 Tax=Candidatus Odyssella thessalonicensis TaxID=84647 RepID=UPI000225B172|nr:hypothetical protein [Candidatus Odyssella thessalonicensis]